MALCISAPCSRWCCCATHSPPANAIAGFSIQSDSRPGKFASITHDSCASTQANGATIGTTAITDARSAFGPFATTQSGEGKSGVDFNRVKGSTDNLRSMLSLKPTNREVASTHLLKVINEEQIDKGSASSANDRNRLRGDLL